MAETKNTFKFTNAKLLDLKAEDGRWRYDAHTKGLAVAVSSTKKSFYFKMWEPSLQKPVEGKLGEFTQESCLPASFVENPLKFLPSKPGLTLGQARSLVLALRAEFSAGRNPFEHAPRPEPRVEMTVGQLFDEYFARHLAPHKKTAQDCQNRFNHDCQEFASRIASTVTRMEAIQWHQSLAVKKPWNGKRQKGGKYTANRALQLMRAVYGKGLLWGLVEGENPFSRIELFEETQRDEALSSTDFRLLWEVLDKEADYIRDYFRLAMLLGNRKSELCRLKWEDVDLRPESPPYCIFRDTKNGDDRRVTLETRAVKILVARRAQAKNEWVFPSPKSNGNLRDPKKAWHRIRQAIGRPNCHIHDIRASTATLLGASNGNLKLVGQILGHKDLKTTARYVRPHESEQRELKERAFASVLPDDAL